MWTGWPAIYVIDEEGVIQQVRSTRGGNLIATVERMLRELRMREYEAPAVPVPMTPAVSAPTGGEGSGNG